MSGVIASIVRMARHQRAADEAASAGGGDVMPAGFPDDGEALPPARRWGFLACSPWTRTMLEIAADLWGDPLSREDLLDIQAGAYLFERRELALREYLRRWAADNPRQMAQLTAEHGRRTG